MEQSDGTAWMALYAQFMLRISLEIAQEDTTYEDMALKYLNHFIRIAGSMDKPLNLEDEMWDEEDGFFYDVLRFPDGSGTRLKIRSLVGLLPLCASTVLDPELLKKLPTFNERYEELVADKSDLMMNIACPETPGAGGRHLLAVMDRDKMTRVLSRLLDEDEFLSPYGIRSLSRYHEENPYSFHWKGESYGVSYLPGESDSSMFGGNSNWRGPIWVPANILILRSLLNLYAYYGDEYKIECPTRSGNMMTLFEVYEEVAGRLNSIFLPNAEGKRPVYGECDTFQNNPDWKDHILFYEYFHAETGLGLGASHQTGWTGLVSSLEIMLGTHAESVLMKAKD